MIKQDVSDNYLSKFPRLRIRRKSLLYLNLYQEGYFLRLGWSGNYNYFDSGGD